MVSKPGKDGVYAPIYKRKTHRKHVPQQGSQTWKIALADFMTAMFIIFMLLWILKQVTPETRSGIAQYFAPTTPTMATSGSGKPLAGEVSARAGESKESASQLGPQGGGPGTPDVGAGTTEVAGYTGTVMRKTGDRPTSVTMETEGRIADIQNQEMLAVQIRQTIAQSPELQALQGNVGTEITPEGLKINLMDSDKTAMFTSSGVEPLPATKKLILEIANKIKGLPNKIAIAGHTDSIPYRSGQEKYTNWELSSARANAARRLLTDNGVDENRIAEVAGRAANDPLFPDDPSAAGNRRLTITMISEGGMGGMGGMGGVATGDGTRTGRTDGWVTGVSGVAGVAGKNGAKAGEKINGDEPASKYLLPTPPGPAPEGRLITRDGQQPPKK